jgi:hypothetical protein
MSTAQDSFKESLETEYVALATSLSPGVALAALINSHKSPVISKYFKEVSIANIPMPISKDQQKNIEKMMNECSLRMSEPQNPVKKGTLGIKEKTKEVMINAKNQDQDLVTENKEKELHDSVTRLIDHREP